MKSYNLYVFLAMIVLLLLSSCGNATTPTAITQVTTTAIQDTATIPADTATTTPTITTTPDPCAPGNIELEVDKLHLHMREFDDASLVAANMSRERVGDAIPNLQRIRREAEDQPIPSCLTDLRTYQIAHMNSVINTLISFMSGSDQQSIDQGISIARQQHDQYATELARVLGLTIVTATPLDLNADSLSPTP
jgi:hypothetical protein